MSGDSTMVTVGGGYEIQTTRSSLLILNHTSGGTGIFLDADLRFGRTESCNTFQNPPLASQSDFTVSVIEVVGFNDISW